MKLGQYLEKRYEVSFYVNILMFAIFVMTRHYIFAGMTLTLAIVQFQPRMIADRIPDTWKEKIRMRVLLLMYYFGWKSYLVSTNGVMKVVRYQKRDNNSLFICRCNGEYRAAIADSSRFCKTTEEAVYLLAAMFYKELNELRVKRAQQQENEQSDYS
jgi:hypothetical protein